MVTTTTNTTNSRYRTNPGDGYDGVLRVSLGGSGVRKDHLQAIEYFRKACDLKNELGCNNYATLKNQGVR